MRKLKILRTLENGSSGKNISNTFPSMKLSIITINYNNLEGLKRTYESVACQTSRAFEWIIIDGGSTDGSREFIVEHQDKFAYWCSELDKGIYNAMNKGIAHASGEYLQFLNSGDGLHDQEVIKGFYELTNDEDIIAGDIALDGFMEQVLCSPDDSELDYDYMRFSTVRHSAAFIKRSLFEAYGGYDESFRIVSDWKFFLEVLIKYNCSYSHWHRVVSDFNTEGISERSDTYELRMMERQKVYEDFLPRYNKTLKKRDRRIKELDIPLIPFIKRKLYWKYKKLSLLFSRKTGSK